MLHLRRRKAEARISAFGAANGHESPGAIGTFRKKQACLSSG
jgi:hypothetical protein